MKHKKRSINKAIERYVHFLRGAMDAALLGKQLYVSRHRIWTMYGHIDRPCSIHYLSDKGRTVIWSCATGTPNGDPITPEDARLVVLRHFIDAGIPADDLSRVERRG